MDGSERYYFERGLSLHAVCPVDEVRLLRLIREAFAVELTVRDGWADLSGSPEAVSRTRAFFDALVKLFLLRGRELELADFELLCRNFREHAESDLDELWSGRIPLGGRCGEIMPRSRRQLEYIRAMRSRDVVFGIGPAGTGKTYLAMAMAVSEFLQRNVGRIVLTRPARESGERLGFLPGGIEEKVSPYLRPLYDALYDMLPREEARDLIDRGIIEVAPLAFMRGRTLNNAFIILDEAQNTTYDQMLMFLTRMGFGSRCVIAGDPSQSDLGRGERSGLQHAIVSLRRIPELAFVFFSTSDVVRHALLEKIINAYGETPAGAERNGGETDV